MNLGGYGMALLRGLAITLSVSLLSLLLATLFGALAAYGSLSRRRTARFAVVAYTTTMRGIPDYVFMLLIYFGGQQLVTRVRALLQLGPADVDPFTAAVMSLAIVFGTYMGEAIRGAWLAIPRGQLDAAKAAGISRARMLRRIVVPQLLFHGAGAFTNVWLVLVKTTPVAALIGLDDILRRAQAAAAATQEPLTFYAAVSVAFLSVTAASEAGARLLAVRAGARFES